MVKYKIVEIFTSLQGEGGQQGTPSTFIRLYGCNLKCAFCDEPLHTQAGMIKEYTAQELLEKCKTYLVTITGGEPSLNNINDLIVTLQDNGNHVVQVETNGYNRYNIRKANILTIAPKEGQAIMNPELYHECKLLVEAGMDETKLAESVKYWLDKDVGVYLQPINNMDTSSVKNTRFAFEQCIKLGVPLSPQLHKLLGVE